MKKALITDQDYGLVMCSSCGAPVLLDATNTQMTGDAKYIVTCNNEIGCKNPLNLYDVIEWFRAK